MATLKIWDFWGFRTPRGDSGTLRGRKCEYDLIYLPHSPLSINNHYNMHGSIISRRGVKYPPSPVTYVTYKRGITHEGLSILSKYNFHQKMLSKPQNNLQKYIFSKSWKKNPKNKYQNLSLNQPHLPPPHKN